MQELSLPLEPKAPYIEPGPVIDKENPFESMIKRFDAAAEILALEPGLYQYLKTSARQHIASIPIQMDDGAVEVAKTLRFRGIYA